MISKIWNTSVCVAPPFHPPLPSHSLFLSHFCSPSLLLSAPSFSLVTSLSLPYLSCLVFPVLTWTRAVLWEYGPLFVKQNAKVCVSVCVSADVSDYMWVSLRLCVHSVCVSLWLVSDGIQSHEASPPTPLQFNSPLILIISDPKPLPLTPSYTQTHTESDAQGTTHTLVPPMPSPLALTSVDLHCVKEYKRKESHLLCCCLCQPTITLTSSFFFLRHPSNVNIIMI